MSENPVIPDEAVEAAARAIYEAQPAKYYLDDAVATWEQLPLSGTGQNRRRRDMDKARAALEAAAPHMLAGGWAQAYAAGFKAATEGRNYDAITSTLIGARNEVA